jgi:hypothetical protein
MTKRGKSLVKGRVHGYDDSVTAHIPDQSGLRLEQLCEEREVGMNGVIHWNDATLEETDSYNLMGWFELDGFHLGKRFTIPGFKGVNVLSPVQTDIFQHLFKNMKADEGHLSLSSIYQNTGCFRYEEPEELTRETNKFNFTFNDITNIGFSARSIHF